MVRTTRYLRYMSCDELAFPGHESHPAECGEGWFRAGCETRHDFPVARSGNTFSCHLGRENRHPVCEESGETNQEALPLSAARMAVTIFSAALFF